MSNDAALIFHDAPERLDAELSEIEGALPAELRGTLLRTGPGQLAIAGSPVHFFDAEGWVAALQFGRGAPRLRARHVETPAFVAERNAGRRLYRRPFTNLPGGRWSNLLRLSLANAAAHDVYAWAGSIVASDAPGHFLMDRDTLEPRGAAPTNAWIKPPGSLSPMPRIDPHTQRLTMYTTTPGVLGNDTLVFHEVDAQWSRTSSVSARLPTRGSFLHDHAFSRKYWVVAEIGRLSLGKALGGAASLYDAIGHDATSPVHLFVVPRDVAGSVSATAIPLPSNHGCFHLFNAYDDASDGALVVDTITYEGRLDFRDLFPPPLRAAAGPSAPVRGPSIVRHRIDPRTGEDRTRIVEGVSGEAPAIHPAFAGRRHRFGYVASPTDQSNSPADYGYFWFHGLAKVDFDDDQHAVWNAGPRRMVSPPTFVPRPGATDEDDGWLLAWTIDAERSGSSVVVLDARDVAAGPIATLRLPVMLPGVSHVEWMPVS